MLVVACASPAFETLYAPRLRIDRKAPIDRTLTMLPWAPRSTRSAATAEASRTGPSRVPAIVRPHSSSSCARNGCSLGMPALFTSTSTPPSARIRSSALRIEAPSVTSIATGVSALPNSERSGASAGDVAADREAATTRAPRARNIPVRCSPMPEVAPVISTERPSTANRSSGIAPLPVDDEARHAHAVRTVLPPDPDPRADLHVVECGVDHAGDQPPAVRAVELDDGGGVRDRVVHLRGQGAGDDRVGVDGAGTGQLGPVDRLRPAGRAERPGREARGAAVGAPRDHEPVFPAGVPEGLGPLVDD